MGERTSLERGRAVARWLLAAVYLLAGCLHVLRPGPFERIVPPWVPAPHAVVIATGVCEILGAIGLMVPRVRRFAGIMLALYAVCVLPANVQHAIMDLGSGTGLGWWYHAPRLVLQVPIVWWALFAGGVVDWPFGRRPA